MIKSLRLDPHLASQLRRAARLKGQTESQFMREVISTQARMTIANGDLSVWEQMADLVVSEGTGEQVSVDPHAAFEQGLLERFGHPG
jgi:hypothetical protein